MKLLAELRRRNVIRAAVLHIGAVWALAQGIAQLGPSVGAPEWVTRWSLIASAIGFPFWVAFSWLYEITPEGIRRESEMAHNAASNRRIARRLDRWIIAVLSVAVVLLLAGLVFRPPPAQVRGGAAMASASDKSIAVLPFVNMSSHKEQDYFSDGLSEELLNQLAPIPQLKVIARTSSFSFKGKDVDVATIAKALNVAHILAGSVRKSGNTLRITAQRVRASDSTHLWSQTCDRALTDVFKVQDEITSDVVAALKLKLLPDQRIANTQRTRNVEAYEQLLLGEQSNRSSTPNAASSALAAYRKAIALDPSYVNAWVSLALAQGNIADFSPDVAARKAHLDAARAAVDHAIAIAPDFAPAFVSRASMRRARRDWIGADADLARAHTLDPRGRASATLFMATSLLFGHRSELNDPDMSIAAAEAVTSIDPLAAQAWVTYGFRLWIFGHPDAARPVTQRALSLRPDNAWALFTLCAIDLRGGEVDAAAARFKGLPGAFRMAGLSMVAHEKGDAQESDRLLRAIEAGYALGFAYLIAQVHSWRGENALALDWLERAFAQRDFGTVRMRYDTFFDALRGDPRYQALISKLELPMQERRDADASQRDLAHNKDRGLPHDEPDDAH